MKKRSQVEISEKEFSEPPTGVEPMIPVTVDSKRGKILKITVRWIGHS